MARMLQALKNLEARSKSTAAKGWLAHLAENPSRAESPTVTAMVPAAAGAQARPATRMEQPAEMLIRPVRRSDGDREGAAYGGEEGRPALTLPCDVAGQRPTLRESGRHECAPQAGRKPGALERQVRRTLSDPARSQPLVQLADRLQREAEQMTSKTLLLVGVGTHSSSHEVLVPIAALLAEKHGERVLLIDADLKRRSLTVGLEHGQASGLAEGLRSNKPLRDQFQATALAGVSLLPAGQGQPADWTADASRLEEILHEAAGQFSLVLVDGGRTPEPAARFLGRLADAVYFVVQLGAVDLSAAQRALADFRAAGARVLGCIAT
jgi:Mrp family chromosome partitioning ATPase